MVKDLQPRGILRLSSGSPVLRRGWAFDDSAVDPAACPTCCLKLLFPPFWDQSAGQDPAVEVLSEQESIEQRLAILAGCVVRERCLRLDNQDAGRRLSLS